MFLEFNRLSFLLKLLNRRSFALMFFVYLLVNLINRHCYLIPTFKIYFMRRLIHRFISCILFLSFAIGAHAQNVLAADWDDVVDGKCDDQNAAWWSSAEATRIAENVMLYQKDCGGWPKNTEMQLVLSTTQKTSLIAAKPGNVDCTIDNEANKLELTYLSKVYAAISDATLKTTIKTSFLNGVQYLLDAQYANGGWPQFYPSRGGYSDHITYNDDAMLNAMNTLRHIYQQDSEFSITAGATMITEAKTAFDKGVECILNTQYIQNGIRTVWCAQHHYQTLEPVMARSYELASLSGYESRDVIDMLMSIDNPSYEIRRAIYCAEEWYDNNRIVGKRLEDFVNGGGLDDIRVIDDLTAPDMWARFYTLDTNTPFFCDRDGIMKYTIAEIGHERRNGYSWYTYAGQDVLDDYVPWFPVWGNVVERNDILTPIYEPIDLSKDLLCYPNPSGASFSVSIGNKSIASVEIYNCFGQRVYSVITTESTLVINDHNLPSGVYFVNVTDSSNERYSQKLIIK